MLAIDFTHRLNRQQYEAVTKGDGPCLVLAGPGSGKTRTLVYRVFYLLNQGVQPAEILLLTFTNRAAHQMLRRVEEMYGREPAGLVGGTFHHVGNLALRRYAERLGYSRAFSILDRSDSKELITQVLEELGRRKDRSFPKAEVVTSIISFTVNSLQPLAEVLERRYPYFSHLTDEIEKISQLYEAKKRQADALDFDDLLSKWFLLLRTEPSARQFYQTRFRYLLIDEYQDTNRLQFEIIKILAASHHNIMAVGDDAQSIYSFRAAEIKNTLDFPTAFPGTKIFRLESNYRSTPAILRLANESIKQNRNQFPKTLRSALRKEDSQTEPPKPVLVTAGGIWEEAAFVSQKILDLHQQGLPWSALAVLFRARYQATELEMALTRQAIPYLIRGGLRFYEQAHIKDVLAYLKVLVNEQDQLAWRRILLRLEGLGPASFNRIWRVIGQSRSPLGTFLTADFLNSLLPRIKPAVGAVQKLLARLKELTSTARPADLLKEILDQEYRAYCLSAYPDGMERVLEVEEMAKIIAGEPSLEGFLSAVVLGEEYRGETEVDKEEAVVISTIHQAKGLEWPTVFLIGLTNGRFPAFQALEDPDALEEERRLFYVAVTRAKRRLFLVQPLAVNPRQPEAVGITSPFLTELPPDCYQLHENVW